MVNEQHRDEALVGKLLKECKGGAEGTPLQYRCVPVSGYIPSSPSALLSFRGRFPAPGPNPSQGLSSGSSPKAS